MNDKCINAKAEPREFWKTFTPYLSGKRKSSSSYQLLEGDRFIKSPDEIAELFNTKFTTIADGIGTDSPYSTSIAEHPSFRTIENHIENLNITNFDFEPTNVKNVQTILNGLNPRKATGYDGISPRVLKTSSQVMAPIICNAINNMINESKFPDPLKKAEVVPIFKAKSRLEWSNF